LSHRLKRNEKMKKIILTALFVLSVAINLSSCRNSETYPEKKLSITIGTAPLESSALIYIAESRGFFADQGLAVTIKEYETGAASLNGLLKKETDIAVPAEYALVGKALQKERARAIASIAKAQYFYLIGRKDRGIQKVADLKGKKIGVVKKTIAEFYLGRFIELSGLDSRQITPVNIDIAESSDLMMGSEIDAIISRPPYITAIENRLGMNAVSWPAQNDQALYAVLVADENWISENPETVNRLLKSLLQAEKYLILEPDAAKAIVQKRLNFDDAYMAAVWSRNQFALSLEQALIVVMEDQARWMIKNNLSNETTIPEILNYIRPEGLEAVKPGSVNIIK
jgi:ABC-type nitrate/sulfonate/bicarbonate transport system substrate-binding protein